MYRALVASLALCCVLSAGVAAAPLAPASDTAPEAAGLAVRSPAHSVAPISASTSTVRSPSLSPSLQAACTDSRHVVCVPGTPNYLAPPSDQVLVTASEGASLDLSGTLAAKRAALGGRFQERTLRAAFSAAESDAARRAVLERHARAVEARTEALREAEREALGEYNRGALTAGAYLRTLAELDVAGDRLRRTVDRLDRYRTRASGSNVTLHRLEAIRADLAALDGPVRERIRRVHAGSAPPTRVFVETSADGVVLSTIVGERGRRTFLREAYLGDVRRQSTGENRYENNIAGALTRAEELYPEAFSSDDVSGVNGDAEVYAVAVSPPRGRLTTYLDGQSGTVFAEHQEKDVASIPTTDRTINETEALALTLGRTHEGGPLNVTVTDPETGERLDANVSVNNRTAGRTGADGTLWTVMPRTVLVTVTAERGDETVTATILARDRQSS